MSSKSKSKNSKHDSKSKFDKDHDKFYDKFDWKQKDDGKKDKDDDKDKYDWKDGKKDDKKDDKNDGKGWELKDDSKGKGQGSSWKYDWKDDWHHGGTKDKVAGQTGAAKDDLFTVDNADTLILDVLDNDPGSAHLWSIDQDALAGSDCVHVERDLEDVVLPSGALLSVNADGTLNYTPPADIADLPEGETFIDSFTYVIRMAKGALSSAQANVTINGVNVDINTPATFSGDQSGDVFEDGTLVTGGTLQIEDPDAGDDAFAAILGNLQGDYGLFTFDLDSGAWTYGLDNNNDAVQALNAGETLTESLLVQSVDGSEAEITVTINGADEGPVPIAERWVLSTTNMVRDTDGATVNIVGGFVAIPSSLAFGDEDIIEFSNMTFLGAATTVQDLDGDLLDDDTALLFQYQTGSGPQNIFVALIDFVGFNPDIHLDGKAGAVIS